MAESMFVRCEDCNYENLAQHSFCGMCGAKLPSAKVAPLAVAQPGPEPEPAAVAPQPATGQPTMRGPSLLGLASDAPDPERVHYLLEDEPGGGGWLRWVAVLVLVGAIGAAGWYWRTEIRAFVAGAPQNPGAVATSDANPVPQATTTPEANSSNATANPPTAATTPGTEGSAANAPAPTPNAAPTTQTAAPPAPAVTDAVGRAPEVKDEKTVDSAANQGIAQSAPKAVVPKIAPAAAASVDVLETQGENYLYGHGVPVDCQRAGKSLLAAAARSSAKAQSVLGTMYATGHCVTRDVPTAYRWFAKALHQDPGNIRIQQDLSVLWQQMTEEERKLAMQTGP
jgi:hypothetical protein